MAQNKSVKIKWSWHWTKNSNKYEEAICGVSFLTSGFYGLPCIELRNLEVQRQVCRTVVFLLIQILLELFLVFLIAL